MYFAERRGKLPLLSVLQNGLRALVDLSGNNYNIAPVAYRSWQIPPYDNVRLTVVPSRSTIRTKYVIWGIVDAVHYVLTTKNNADCKNQLSIRGRIIGDIYFDRYSPDSQLSSSTLNQSFVATTDDTTKELLISFSKINVGRLPTLTIDFTYGQALLSPGGFFQAAYLGIIYATMNGIYRRVRPFTLHSFAETGAYLQMLDPPSGQRTEPPFLELSHIVYLLDHMVQHAVAQRNYRELVGALKIDGVPVGQMAIRMGQSVELE